jgi:hypothetical protein
MSMLRVLTLTVLGITGVVGSIGARPVKLTEVEWRGTGCHKIEMPMRTVYFGKDKGVSGFTSFIDPDGNDWIASCLPPGPTGASAGSTSAGPPAML